MRRKVTWKDKVADSLRKVHDLNMTSALTIMLIWLYARRVFRQIARQRALREVLGIRFADTPAASYANRLWVDSSIPDFLREPVVEEADDDDESCSLCCTHYMNVRLRCGHAACADCIGRLVGLVRNGSCLCPFCRQEIIPAHVRRIAIAACLRVTLRGPLQLETLRRFVADGLGVVQDNVKLGVVSLREQAAARAAAADDGEEAGEHEADNHNRLYVEVAGTVESAESKAAMLVADDFWQPNVTVNRDHSQFVTDRALFDFIVLL